MKTLTSKLFGFALITAIVLSSCNTTIEVAKRQHRKGYHIAFNKKDSKNSITNIQEEQNTPVGKTTSEGETTAAIETPKENKTIAPIAKTETSVAPSENIKTTQKKVKKPSFAKTYKAIKKAKKEIQNIVSKKGDFQTASYDDTDTESLLLLILAILLPPLAVYLVRDLGVEFWISVILTLLFWLPGIIYAILVVLGEI